MTEHQNLMLAEAYAALERIVAVGAAEGITISAHISMGDCVLWVGASNPSWLFESSLFKDFINRVPSELNAWEQNIVKQIQERAHTEKAKRIAELEAELSKLKS